MNEHRDKTPERLFPTLLQVEEEIARIEQAAMDKENAESGRRLQLAKELSEDINQYCVANEITKAVALDQNIVSVRGSNVVLHVHCIKDEEYKLHQNSVTQNIARDALVAAVTNQHINIINRSAMTREVIDFIRRY